jgi:glycosyltransferase involved in cell wall biosynthesis
MKIETEQQSPRRIAFLLDNLNGGGAERVILGMASGFADLGYSVDLLVCELHGELCASVPHNVNLIALPHVGKLEGLADAIRGAGWHGFGDLLFWVASGRKIPRSLCHVRAIRDYLRAQRPAVLCSALGKSNISAVLAAAVAGVETRVYVGAHIAHSQRSEQSRKSGKRQNYSIVPMLRRCFARAQGVIAVSRGVADDTINFLGVDPARVHVVYNPVVTAQAAGNCETLPVHPWFNNGALPVILGMGRLVEQKNFPLLIRAFAAARAKTAARLVILGGDKSSAEQMAHRRQLQALAAELGVADDVALLGYQSDPYAFLRAASVFVLSSNFEGFGNVLVEALQAGCPVVSTDCPSGPAEILDSGQYGTLVPVDDADSLARAILSTLKAHPNADKLRKRGNEFSLQRALDGYHQIFFGERAALIAAELGEPSPASPSSRAIRHASGSHRMTHNSRGRVTI